MKKAGKNEIREHNKTLILNSLRREEGSRAELAQRTHLANSAVSSLVSELMEQNFIYEKVVAESSGGRKPIILSLNPGAAYVMVLRIDGSHITTAVVNFNLEIECIEETPALCHGPEKVTAELEKVIGSFMERHGKYREKIVSVGVQIPGVVDHFNNRVVYSTILGLENFCGIQDTIRRLLPTDVRVIKSSDAELLGESLKQGFDNESSYLYVVYETGIGMSFYEKGGIVQFRNGGMQIGHMKLVANSRKKCNCGKYGCVEAYVCEEPAIASLMEKMGLTSREALRQQLGLRKLELEDLIGLANAGAPYCTEVMEEQATYLGLTLASVANLFSPHKIILGGKAGLLSEKYKKIIAQTLNESILGIYANIPVLYATASFEAGCMGIADSLFRELIFRQEN